MTLELTCQSSSAIPIELAGVVPDRVASLSVAEIERLPIFFGKQELPLAELFQVQGDPAKARLRLLGDCRAVHWIGAGQASGEIVVEGPAGRHVGSEMSGGRIEVAGDVGDFVGAEMRGGLIRVRGNAGNLAGGAYRGSRLGMIGGAILIDGDVGHEAAHSMRRGLLAVGGNAGDLTGCNMAAGTVLLRGKAGIRTGAGMRRGTIGLLHHQADLLPTFRRACRYQPQFLRTYMLTLARWGWSFPKGLLDGSFVRYCGDFLAGGRGEVLLRED